MAEESDGTNSYFKLIGIVKEVLDEGTPLVVDELDAHLHPLLTKHAAPQRYFLPLDSANQKALCQPKNQAERLLCR